MSSGLSWFLMLALAAPLAAADLRATLAAMGADAGVTVVLDRSVGGAIDVSDVTGDPRARLDAAIERAGLTAVRVDPPEGRPTMVIRAGSGHKGAHAGHFRARFVAAPPPPPVQIDAMVVAVAPGTVAELAAFGRELAPLAGRDREGTEFLDGPGPGVKMLAFDRVEPRLNEHLPWGEVGAHRDGFYEIRRRQSVLVPPGAVAQVPLEASKVIEEPTHREAIVKQALVIRPEVLPGGRIRLEVALRRGVAFPDEVDPAMMVGGRLGFTTEIALGQEVLITGLGVSAPPSAARCEPVDPFERFRRPRLRDYERRRCAPARCETGQVVVRLLARSAVTSVAP